MRQVFYQVLETYNGEQDRRGPDLVELYATAVGQARE